MSCASAGVYRCGGTPSRRRVGARLAGRLAHGRCSRVIWCARTGGGQKKTPHAWRGRRAVRSVSGQHGRRSRSRPVTGPSLARDGGGPSTRRPRRTVTLPGRICDLESRRAPGTDETRWNRNVRRGAAGAPRRPGRCSSPSASRWFATGVVDRPPGLAWDRFYDVVLFNTPYVFGRPGLLFAATVGPRPAGLEWDRLFDVVFYNAPYLSTAALCWVAAGRVRTERLAWRALTGACCSAPLANGLRTWAAGIEGNGPYPAADRRAGASGLPAPLRDHGRAHPHPGGALPPEHVARRRHRRPRHHGRRGRLPDRAVSEPHGRPAAAAARRARDAGDGPPAARPARGRRLDPRRPPRPDPVARHGGPLHGAHR